MKAWRKGKEEGEEGRGQIDEGEEEGKRKRSRGVGGIKKEEEEERKEGKVGRR